MFVLCVFLTVKPNCWKVFDDEVSEEGEGASQGGDPKRNVTSETELKQVTH